MLGVGWLGGADGCEDVGVHGSRTSSRGFDSGMTMLVMSAT